MVLNFLQKDIFLQFVRHWILFASISLFLVVVKTIVLWNEHVYYTPAKYFEVPLRLIFLLVVETSRRKTTGGPTPTRRRRNEIEDETEGGIELQPLQNPDQQEDQHESSL